MATSQFVLLLLMIIGRLQAPWAWSKVLRIRIAFELSKRNTEDYQPRKVVAIRFNDEVIDEKRIWTVLGMLSSWTVLVTASILAFSLLEPSLI